MSRQEEVYQGSFVAKTLDGEFVEIEMFQTFLISEGRFGRERFSGRKRYRTLDGHRVRKIEQGRYEIDQPSQTLCAMTDNPNAP